MSLGGPFSLAMNSAVAASANAGVIYTVAAGNSNRDACMTSPASEPSAITVGATTIKDVRAGFSNFGTCVDIWAPGADIISASRLGGTATARLSGTSMSSPCKSKHNNNNNNNNNNA
jgi:subtilisin family serine protease